MRRLLTALGLALLLSPAGASAVTNGDRDVKILGGAVAAPGQFPWMAALVDAQAERAIDGAYCGGTVIAPKVVLTAAHCVENSLANEMDVVTGRTRLSQEDEGERIRVARILVHPKYDNRNVFGDAALLQLSRATTVQPLPIAHPVDDDLTAPGTRVITTGWGATEEGGRMSDSLLFVRLTMRSDSYCDRVYGDIDDASQLCIGSKRAGEDSCQGDSGGPVVSGDGAATRLVGLVSYGRGCGRKGVPGVYTRVSRYAQWVDDNTAQMNGDAVPPAPPVNPPIVRISNVVCGEIYCNVFFRTTGRPPAGGIALNYVRRRSKGRKPVDDIAFATQLSETRWKARANLPFGNVTLYAIPLTASMDDLDGEGDVERYRITLE